MLPGSLSRSGEATLLLAFDPSSSAAAAVTSLNTDPGG